jgi:outer membrane protein OmpA-like peptidoglycan-associated protein
MLTKQSVATNTQAMTAATSAHSVVPGRRAVPSIRLSSNQVMQQMMHAGVIQAKLTVNTPNDKFELEADRVADHVMRMPAGGTAEPPPSIQRACTTCSHEQETSPIQRACKECDDELMRKKVSTEPLEISDEAESAGIQRKCSTCEEEEVQRTSESVQRKCSKCEEEEIQRQRADSDDEREQVDGHTPEVTRSVEDQINAIRAGGQPLPLATRAFFESRFDRDFSNVRIHTDAKAAESARSVNALAYTVGHNIVFATGHYQPETIAGQRLLAHELTHVLQQRGAPRSTVATVQRQGGEGSEPTAEDLLQGSGGKSQTCANAEKGFSRKEPAKACPKPTHRGTKELGHFHFCLDSIDPVDQATFDSQLDEIASEPASTRFLVHGHASVDGDQAGNFRLSCHRANRVTEAMVEKGIAESRIETGSRGPTTEFPGGPEFNRVVVVYGQTVGKFGEVDEEEPTCEGAPRKLGDIKPEIPCDDPTTDLTVLSHGPHLKHFHFCLDSDVLTEESVADLREFAFSQAAKSRFMIHGFASSEGNEAYNKVLSCHRALRIMRELLNLGVRSTQIREVSGLGEFKEFGDKEFSRVVVVLAEEGEISSFQEPSTTPRTSQEKSAIRNEARQRLIRGDYKFAADAYISFWTCGRVPSLSQGIARVEALTQDEAGVSGSAVTAGDIEEGVKINSAVLADRDFTADNPLECVQARLADIAFHHAVVNNAGLPRELIVGNRPEARHEAGRHLAHLAGFSKCAGRFDQRGSRDDSTLATDPRATLVPACAEVKEPTRLLTPRKGEAERKAPEFELENPPEFTPNSGSIDFPGAKGGGGGGTGPVDVGQITAATQDRLETQGPIFKASASVQLVGDPSVFPDYELGFIQTVLGDVNVVEYVSGHRVIQQLPIPIRDADSRTTPTPWTEVKAQAHSRPSSTGKVDIETGIPFLNITAPAFVHFDPTSNLSGNLFDTWQRRTRIAIWLIARRLGAPLDRFSVHFLRGAIFDLDQKARSLMRRFLNFAEPERFPSDKELLIREGEFNTTRVSDSPADPRFAQLHGAIVRDIDLKRHFIQILEPPARRPDEGMSFGEYADVVRQILDNFIIFDNAEAARANKGTAMPRLGFEFVPLFIRVPIDKRTGRLALLRSDQGGPLVTVEANIPALGIEAREGLAAALSVRLRKRDPLGTGQNVVLRVPAQDGGPFRTSTRDSNIGILTIFLPPRQGGKKEPDLLKHTDLLGNEDVKQEFADMWECTRLVKERCFDLDNREFGGAYSIDRLGGLHRVHENTFQVSDRPDSFGETQLNLVCGASHNPSGFALGTVHTHPDTIKPSDADMALFNSGNCGNQHFIIGENQVAFIASGQPARSLGSRTSVLPRGRRCDDRHLRNTKEPICE